MYLLTEEERDLLVQYLNEENSLFLDGEGPDKVFRVANDLRKKMTSDMKAAMRDRVRLQQKVERLSAQKKTAAQATVEARAFQNLGVDSVDLAWAIVEACREQRVHCTKNRLVLFVYECYCSWLGSHMELITIDTPVITKWGPQFWRVWKQVDPEATPPDGSLRKLSETGSGLVPFVRNVVAKYATYNVNNLKEYYIKSDPYRKAEKAGGGKTNTPIDPRDIYLWRQGQGRSAE